jgi:cation transport ATPase
MAFNQHSAADGLQGYAAVMGGKDGSYSRTTPAQKLQIVGASSARHGIVAVTGTGVSWYPARCARPFIGVAMGNRLFEVARGAANVVLLDDDFTSWLRRSRRAATCWPV